MHIKLKIVTSGLWLLDHCYIIRTKFRPCLTTISYSSRGHRNVVYVTFGLNSVMMDRCHSGRLKKNAFMFLLICCPACFHHYSFLGLRKTYRLSNSHLLSNASVIGSALMSNRRNWSCSSDCLFKIIIKTQWFSFVHSLFYRLVSRAL